VPGGKIYRVPLHLNAKEIQLIAYLAWLQGQSKGQTISLDKLRKHIFGYGRPDEDATPKKLQDALDSAKKRDSPADQTGDPAGEQRGGLRGHPAQPGHLCYQEQALRALGGLLCLGSRGG